MICCALPTLPLPRVAPQTVPREVRQIIVAAECTPVTMFKAADAAADLSPRNWSAIWPRWQSLDGQRSAICAATARRFHHVPDIISRKAMLRRG